MSTVIAAERSSTSGRFAGAIAAVTIMPLALAFTVSGESVPITLSSALTVVNVGHIGLTSVFWIDQRYRNHMAAKPAFYYFAPLALIFACISMTFILGNAVITALLYSAWLTFHYGKQNLGMLSITALATRGPRPASAERFVLTLAWIGGLACWVPLVNDASIFMPLRTVGIVLTAMAAGGGAGLAIAAVYAGASPVRALMLFASAAFFVPVALANSGAGLIFMATAHAIQYAMVTTPIAKSWTRLLTLIPFYGLGVLIQMGLPYFGPIGGALAYTIVIGFHFITDAGVWKLREPFQRQAFRESFAFLFR